MDDVPGVKARADAREFVASAAGRIDAAIANAFEDLTRARVQRLIEGGHVLLNGGAARKSAQVSAGDRVAITIPEVEHAAVGSQVELPVLYEDDLVVAVNKPAGLAVHGAPGDRGPSVAGWFVARYPDVARQFDAERPGIAHRLDKDTTGVLVLAKTPVAQAAISGAFEARTTAKTYLAVCDGVPARDRAVVDAPIGRHPGDRTRMAIAKGGRESRTEYELLGTDGERSLLLVKPETGRTHQIRVHLAAVHLPVALDAVYGKRKGVVTEGRQLLHAYELRVPHPGGGTLVVAAPIPADMVAAIRAIGLVELASRYAERAPARVEHGDLASADGKR